MCVPLQTRPETVALDEALEAQRHQNPMWSAPVARETEIGAHEASVSDAVVLIILLMVGA